MVSQMRYGARRTEARLKAAATLALATLLCASGAVAGTRGQREEFTREFQRCAAGSR